MFLTVLFSIITVLWLPRKRVLLFGMSKLNFKASERANDEELLTPVKGKKRKLAIPGEDAEIFAPPVHFSLCILGCQLKMMSRKLFHELSL